MEPLAALSLAGNLIQFVDFGSKLLSQSCELYRSRSGTLAADDELNLVTADLRALILKIKKSSISTTSFASSDREAQEVSQRFERICDEAVALAQEIISRLDGARISGKHRAWKSLRHAVKSAWSQKEIENLVARLSTLKQTLETRLLFSLRCQLNLLSTQMSDQFHRLDLQTKQIITALTEKENPSGHFSNELRDQTRALTQLLSRLSNFTQEEMCGSPAPTRHDGQGSEILERRANQDISTIVEMLNVSQKEEDRLRLSVEHSILASLTFPTMTHRYENITDAHEETFHWIFHENNIVDWHSFSAWLASGSGVYWVNGKAGSGKSTLMKFIYNDARTRTYLEAWAEGMPLSITTFFFWNSGSLQQKSHRGLLQAILHDILSQYPEFIPIILPLEWARTYSSLLDKAADGPQPIEWHLKLLMDLFNSLIVHAAGKIKLCLFIDGLDEYDGDHEELGEFFKNLASSPHMKVCISSRPWVVFEFLFKNCPSLRLQDLTRSDIERYVNDRLRSRDAFRRLAANDPKSALSLVHEVVQKADGVFLWVRLVVSSLLDGLRNRDTISDLQSRLLLFPRELGPLYEHLLSLIEPFYIEWASKAFQLMRAAQEHLSCMDLTENNTPPLTTLALHLAINEGIRLNQNSISDIAQIIDECKNTKFQLTARCAGLLEVRDDMLERDHQYTLTGTPPQTINWLHRTARDYIESPRKWDQILQITARTDFNPNTSLLRSCVILLGQQRAVLDATDRSKEHNQQIISDMELHATFLSTRALTYAYHADLKTHNPATEILDRLSCLLSTPYKGGGDPYEDHRLNWEQYIMTTTRDDGKITHNGPFFGTFLPLAVNYGLLEYIRERVKKQRHNYLEQASFKPLLCFIPNLLGGIQDVDYPAPRVEMVQLLLELGADPNAQYDDNDSSPWKMALKCLLLMVEEHHYPKNSSRARVYLQILSLYIRHGADPLAYGQSGLRGTVHTARDILIMFQSRFTDYIDEIDGLIDTLDASIASKRDRQRNEGPWKRRMVRTYINCSRFPRRRYYSQRSAKRSNRRFE